VATDALDGTRHPSVEGRLRISVPARSVRMLKIDLA
jgi:hypothetical protein